MRDWPLWTLRAPALAYWLAVDLAALFVTAFVVLTAPPPVATDWPAFSALAATAGLVVICTSVCGQTYGEAQRSAWAVHVAYLLAGVFTLPLDMLVVLMLGPALQGALCPRPRPHRWIFTTAATMLATVVSRMVAGWETPHWNTTTVVLAGASLILVRALVVAIGLRLRRPDAPVDAVLGEPLDVTVGLVAVCLGGLMAAAMIGNPMHAILTAPPLVLLERAAQLPKWRKSAQLDPKTGLTNAVHWDRLASEELLRASARQAPAAVLLLDLDHFKRVNDRLGHLAGDAALAAIAELLRGCVSRSDLVGRFGGEEFVMLLPGADSARAEEVAQGVRRGVATLRVLTTAADGRPHELAGLTVSIGVSTSTRFGYHLPDLMVAADSALLAAKGAGRNLVTIAA